MHPDDHRSPRGVAPAPVVVPVTEARSRIADLVGRVQHGGHRIVLTRHGRAAAVLVPPADLDRLLGLERAAGLDVVESTTIDEHSEVVWATLVGRVARERWWPGVLLLDHVGAELVEPRPDGGTTRAEVTGLVPDRLLELAWREEGWSSTTCVRIELAGAATTTTVRVVHTGWEQLSDGAVLAEQHRRRWRGLLAAWRRTLTPAGEG